VRTSGVRVAIAIVLSVCFVMRAAASTVLVFLSPQEAVIATDSLSNRVEGGGPRLVCKIAQVSDHMLFASTGIGVAEYPPFDPYALAKISSTNSRTPREAALKYASAALGPLQRVWGVARARYLKIQKESGPEAKGVPHPQSFVFVGLDQNGNIAAVGSDFVEDSSTPPKLRAEDLQEFTTKNSYSFVSLGVRGSVPSAEVIDAWIYKDKIGAPAALKRGIEEQIGATPKLVGPPISIVRLSRDGSLQWVSRGVCK